MLLRVFRGSEHKQETLGATGGRHESQHAVYYVYTLCTTHLRDTYGPNYHYTGPIMGPDHSPSGHVR